VLVAVVLLFDNNNWKSDYRVGPRLARGSAGDWVETMELRACSSCVWRGTNSIRLRVTAGFQDERDR
jgi:hypothetical protein